MRAKWDRSKGRPEPIAALNRVREEENSEPLVDLRVAAPSLVITRESVIPWVRKRVAEMAEKAAQSLPKGIQLAVMSAFRPFEQQVMIYEWMTACAKEAFPDSTYPALKRRVNRWVAPVDQKAPPGHCTGAAIDVMLAREDGEELDVVSPFERFQATATYSLGLSREAQANRQRLVKAMLDQGFSNCRDEYWHYSYGDAGWAVRLGHDRCFYGLVELDPKLWKDQHAAFLERMKGRSNPFLDHPE